jgi:hypothetical protein
MITGPGCRNRSFLIMLLRYSGSLFLKHVVNDDPFPWNLLDGARGVQLAELGIRKLEIEKMD